MHFFSYVIYFCKCKKICVYRLVSDLYREIAEYAKAQQKDVCVNIRTNEDITARIKFMKNKDIVFQKLLLKNVL